MCRSLPKYYRGTEFKYLFMHYLYGGKACICKSMIVCDICTVKSKTYFSVSLSFSAHPISNGYVDLFHFNTSNIQIYYTSLHVEGTVLQLSDMGWGGAQSSLYCTCKALALSPGSTHSPPLSATISIGRAESGGAWEQGYKALHWYIL